jgi:hypothetical protein
MCGCGCDALCIGMIIYLESFLELYYVVSFNMMSKFTNSRLYQCFTPTVFSAIYSVRSRNVIREVVEYDSSLLSSSKTRAI